MSNQDKYRRGVSLKRVLSYMMHLCKELGYIVEYDEDYKAGRPGYTDQKQFKAAYRIRFDDSTEWIVFTTTSLRDRIKEPYWDSFNLKHINQNIKKAFLVYPDEISEKDKHAFVSKETKIQAGGEFSPLDGLLSQESFFSRIEAYALRNLSLNQQRERKGNNFEKRIASILNNPSNFEKWKNNDDILVGLHFNIFEKLVHTFRIQQDNVVSLMATSDKSSIGLLPSGGPAKTDVLVTVVFTDGHTEYFPISCKRTSNSTVSVHQYSADTFADVLSPTDTELRRVLNQFQTYGNKRDMNAEDAQLLEEKLQPLLLSLCQWAMGGVGGEGDPEKQWARYILAYDNNTENCSIHDLNDYCMQLLQDCSRSFGTPFSWTYQGTRGTNIQLKAPVFL